MGASRTISGLRKALCASVAACALAPALALAQPATASSGIYRCVDDRGRVRTSDRPIAECSAREQQVLNKDGSVKAIHPPTMTAEERAQKDARERAAAEQRSLHAEAVRRDRYLVARYPSEAAHSRAREASIDSAQAAMKAIDARLRELRAERKPLLDEAEFYKGKPLPAKLKTAIDANDAAVEGQRSAQASQQAELARINANYDAELERLRRLWSGAAPGSLGSLTGNGSAKPTAARR